MVVAGAEGGEVLLETRVLVDGLAACGGRVAGVAGGAGEGDLQGGLADVVEAEFDGDGEVAAGAGDDVAEAEGEAGGDFAEVDAAGAVERVGGAADVVLAVEGDGAAGGDEGGGEDAIVVGEDDLGAEAEAAVEGEPVEGCVAGAEVEVDADVGALLLEGVGVGEEVSAGAKVKARGERGGDIEAGAGDADAGGEAESGEGMPGLGDAAWLRRESDEGGWGWCCFAWVGVKRRGGGVELGVFDRRGLCEGEWRGEDDGDGERAEGDDT